MKAAGGAGVRSEVLFSSTSRIATLSDGVFASTFLEHLTRGGLLATARG